MPDKKAKEGSATNELSEYQMHKEIFSVFGPQIRDPREDVAHSSSKPLTLGTTVDSKTATYTVSAIINNREYKVQRSDSQEFYMRIGPIECTTDGPQMKREVFFLKCATSAKPENRMHFLQLVDRGRCTGKYNFMITTLADVNLDDLRKNRLKAEFKPSTALALSAQTLQAVHDVHCCEYIHRDIRPANFIIGLGNAANVVYMVNFSLAYKYSAPTKSDKGGKPRTPKKLTKWKSTVTRYQSRSYHREVDMTRLDDLESWFYMCIDFFGRGLLPWKKTFSEREMLLAKQLMFCDGYEEIYSVVPKNFRAIKNGIDRAVRLDPIDYPFFAEALLVCSKQVPTNWNGPFEWQMVAHNELSRLFQFQQTTVEVYHHETKLATKDVSLGSAEQAGKQSSETGSAAKTSNASSEPQSQPKENRIPSCDNGLFLPTGKSKDIPQDRTKRKKVLKDENIAMKKELKAHRPLKSVISTVLAALPSKCKGKKEASTTVHKMRTKSTLRTKDYATTPKEGYEKTRVPDTVHRRDISSQEGIKETQQPHQECNAKDILPTTTKRMNIAASPQKQPRASNEDMKVKANSKSPKPSPLTRQPQASPAKSRKLGRHDDGQSGNIKRQTVATQASEESSRRLPAQRSNTREPQATSSPGRNPRIRFAQRKIYCVRDRNDPDYKTLRALWSEFSDASSEQSILSSQDVGSRELPAQAAVVDGSRSICGNEEREITGTSGNPQEFTATNHELPQLTAPSNGHLLEAMQSGETKQWREPLVKGISTSLSDATQH